MRCQPFGRLLWSDICVFLIWIGVSLPSTHNPDNASLISERASKVLVQAHLIVVFSLLGEAEASGSIRVDESRKDSLLFYVESYSTGDSVRGRGWEIDDNGLSPRVTPSYLISPASKNLAWFYFMCHIHHVYGALRL